MRKMGVVLMALMVAGCASQASLRSKDPVEAYSGSRPADDVATCIVAEWSKKSVSVTVQPIAGGKSVVLLSPNGPPAGFVDITQEGGRTLGKAYSQMGGLSWFGEHAKPCFD